MQRVLFILIALVFALPVHAAEQKQQITYRNFIWGVSKEDVRKYETAIFYKEEGDSLLFLLKPDTFRRKITYGFKDDKLWRIKYEYIDLNLPNSSPIIDMIYDEQKGLTDLYGKPSNEELIWKNPMYRDRPDYWGSALFSRDLRFRTTWDAPGARIVLEAYYDGYQYQIFYTIEQVSDAPASTNAIALPKAETAPAEAPSPQP